MEVGAFLLGSYPKMKRYPSFSTCAHPKIFLLTVNFERLWLAFSTFGCYSGSINIANIPVTRETSIMTERADILVIGGGVMGTSIAYHLARQKAGRVLLLERRAICSGTTGHSGAIIRQHYSNDFTIRMAKESLHIFQHFDDLVGGDCGFVTTGMLVLVDEQGAATLQANVGMQQEQSVNTKLISPAEVAEVAPGFSGEGVALACY